jgi:mitogen-activated protein kinase kinase kinase
MLDKIEEADTPSKIKGQIKQSGDCEMFNRIKLGKKLGEGAYGSVYQALSLSDHKFIVVKKIRVPDNISKDSLNEIDMLSKLEHQNIVKYYDSCLVSKESEI